jgi:hypothetical protein
VDLRPALVRFLGKFAHLYDSGVPLAEALGIARRGLPEALETALGGVVEDLYRGSSLADALERRPDAFTADVVGVLRAGETRGELGNAARAAAEGLRGRVLDAEPAPGFDLESVLGGAGDARAVHVEPDGRLRLRVGRRLVDGGSVPAAAIAAELARRAGIAGEWGRGAFLWSDRLLRVAVTATPEGPAAVVRLSQPPGAEPEEAARWRKGPPALLLVPGGRDRDPDACLRSILAAFDKEATRRVAVGLPVPEALPAAALEDALALDPDVLCAADVRRRATALRLADAVHAGIHVVASSLSPRPFESIPHARLA